MWCLFPFALPLACRDVIKRTWVRCVLALFSPGVIFIILTIIAFVAYMTPDSGKPSSVPYHNAADLERLTGVEFPEIVATDSMYYYNPVKQHIEVCFLPKKPLDKQFINRLDRACSTDSCCWQYDKANQVYHYFLYYDSYPVDRAKGTHQRLVNGEPDWDGNYVSVDIPVNGDTIIVEDGWFR